MTGSSVAPRRAQPRGEVSAWYGQTLPGTPLAHMEFCTPPYWITECSGGRKHTSYQFCEAACYCVPIIAAAELHTHLNLAATAVLRSAALGATALLVLEGLAYTPQLTAPTVLHITLLPIHGPVAAHSGTCIDTFPLVVSGPPRQCSAPPFPLHLAPGSRE